MRTFTPGPWKADRAGNVITCDNDAALICECNQDPHWHPQGIHAHSNARLIAAAPDLLKACKAMEKLFFMCGNGIYAAGGVTDAINTAKAQAKAAIAKATT